MSVNELRLANLIQAWRNTALQYERGLGHAADLSEEAREASASTWRLAASMLAQDAQLCGSCDGVGKEYAKPEPEEGLDGGWFDCKMCDATGRFKFSFSCISCGRTEQTVFRKFHEDFPDLALCSGCHYLLERGLDPFQKQEPPFGAPYGERVPR